MHYKFTYYIHVNKRAKFKYVTSGLDQQGMMRKGNKNTDYTQREAIQRVRQYVKRSHTKGVETEVVILTRILLYVSMAKVLSVTNPNTKAISKI